MILAAGEQSGLEQLLTEDLNAGEKIAGIEIAAQRADASSLIQEK